MSDAKPKPTAADKRQKKAAARLYAVQALFQMEASGQPADRVAREFETYRFGAVYDEDEMAEGDLDLHATASPLGIAPATSRGIDPTARPAKL